MERISKIFRLHIVLFGTIFCLGSVHAQDSMFLDIERVISQVKNDNIQIKKELLKTKVAHGEYLEAKEWWLPNVFLGTTFHHLDGATINSDGRIFRNVDRQSRWYGGNVNLNWDIGKGISTIKSKKAQLEKAELLGLYAQNSVVLSAIETYYSLLSITAQKALYEDLKNNKDDLLTQLKVQVDAGLILEGEYLLAKGNRSLFSLRILDLQYRFEQVLSDMLLTLNLEKIDGLYYDMNDLSIINIDTLIANENKEHPFINALKKKKKGETLEAKAMINSLLIPHFGIGYGVGPFGEGYSDADNTYRVEGYLGWNIPLGQLFYAGKRKKSEAKQKIYTLEIFEAQMLFKRKITEFKKKLTNSRAILTLAKQGGTDAKAALEYAIQRQNKGIGNIHDVLLYQEEYVQVMILYFNAVADYNVTFYKLKEAMGERL
ncbi:MAG: TolC family protein [Saprospiraceae bacterium]